MKIGVIQASSQIEKNTILYECTKDYGEVINFGCFEDEENYSYVEIALEICLLISSQAVDFIVTGCSSGQGMMIACNSLPNLICGYYQHQRMLIYLEESMMVMWLLYH